MTTVLDRFLRYVQYDTQSDEQSTTCPSTPTQLVLLNDLADELRSIGLADASVDAYGYVMATIPATTRKRGVPTIGFIAHVDTSPEMPGARVAPIVHRAYDGRDLVLPDDPSAVLRTADIPELAGQIGCDIVTASGTTLLGADDKAGVAEIVTAAAYLIAHPEIPHGDIRVAFTPDEEIGRGTDHFDIGRFAASCAYTLDGGARGQIEVESFSADALIATFHGFNTHPGYAKHRMVNAIKAAAAFIDRLPRGSLSPETTSGYEGFVHPYVVHAGVERTSVRLIVRDFVTGALAEKEALLERLAREAAELHPGRAWKSPSRCSIATCGKCSNGGPRSRPTRARRYAAPASSRGRIRFAAAPMDHDCRSWDFRPRICSPANTISTPAWNGCLRRTWKKRSRSSSTSPESGKSTRTADARHTVSSLHRLPSSSSARRFTLSLVVLALSMAASIAAADQASIVASNGDAFIGHQSGTDVWTIGSATLEVAIGLDASRTLALQRISNPSTGRGWDITPAADVTITAGSERITLGNTGGVSLQNVVAQATDFGVVLTFAFEQRALRLQFLRSYACYPGSPTIETWTRVGSTAGDTPLTGLVALQMTVPLGRVRWLGGLRGDAAGGSVEDAFVVADRAPEPGERIELGAAGRSSETFVPLVLVDGETDEFYSGLMWSGAWHAAIERAGERLRVSVDFPGVTTTVTPSRAVELPHAFFGVRAHAGPDESGALHQFVMQGIRHGRPFAPLVTYNTWFVYGTTINEDAMVAEMDRASTLGVELFVIDAGWYVGAGATSDFDFDAGLGTWQADADRFPSGLASLADYAHGVGMQFGLWVEPERVALSTVDQPGLAREAWLATHDGDYVGPSTAQICLVRPEARQWLRDQLVALIEQVHPDYLKWDNNGWTNCNRTGHGHGPADGNLQHVQALYGLLDELRRRYPTLQIENVSGGGARIDFGMIAYSDTAWMDDRTSPAGHVRHNIEGLTFAFPPAYLLSFLIDADGEPIAGASDLPLLVRSRGAGVLGLTYRNDGLDEETAKLLGAQIAEYKTYRDTVARANASLLTLQTPYDDSGWDALEEVTGDGLSAVIFAFKSDFGDNSLVLRPRGLVADAMYDGDVDRSRPSRYGPRRRADAGWHRAPCGGCVAVARPGTASAIARSLALRRDRPRTPGVPLLHQTLQLGDRRLVVVDLQPQDGIVVEPDAAVLLHDDQCGRLLSALVAAAGLTALERGNQALRQMARRVLEPLDHVLHHVRPGQDVALRRGELAALLARPFGRLRPRICRVLALQIHHRELPSLLAPGIGQRVGVFLENLLDDRGRLHLLPQQRERLASIADIHDRLRRGDADVGVGPEDAIADGEDARLHRAADFAGEWIEPENRKRAGVPQRPIRRLGRARSTAPQSVRHDQRSNRRQQRGRVVSRGHTPQHAPPHVLITTSIAFGLISSTT